MPMPQGSRDLLALVQEAQRRGFIGGEDALGFGYAAGAMDGINGRCDWGVINRCKESLRGLEQAMRAVAAEGVSDE